MTSSAIDTAPSTNHHTPLAAHSHRSTPLSGPTCPAGTHRPRLLQPCTPVPPGRWAPAAAVPHRVHRGLARLCRCHTTPRTTADDDNDATPWHAVSPVAGARVAAPSILACGECRTDCLGDSGYQMAAGSLHRARRRSTRGPSVPRRRPHWPARRRPSGWGIVGRRSTFTAD